MKTIITIVLLFAINTMNAQFVKNIKTFTTSKGIELKKGIKIKILETIEGENGQALWTYHGMKKIPAPKEYFNKSKSNKVYEVEKVIRLKGIKDDPMAVLVVFYDGKNKCYSHIIKALDSNELIIIK